MLEQSLHSMEAVVDEKTGTATSRIKTGSTFQMVVKPATIIVRTVCTPADSPSPRSFVTLKNKRREYQKDTIKGVAWFDSIDPGSYQISLELKDTDTEYCRIGESDPIKVASGQSREVPVVVELYAALEVSLVCSSNGEQIEGAIVSIKGPSEAEPATQPATDPVLLENLLPGAYEVMADLPESAKGMYSEVHPSRLAVVSGMKTELILEAQKNIRVLEWNISGLGGGLRWTEERPEHIIDSYATLISAMKADICVLLGIRQCGRPRYESKKTSDGNVYLESKDTLKDTGKKEIDRILKSLNDADASAKWEAGYLRSEEDESVIYHNGGTACILFKTGEKLSMKSARLVKGPSDKNIGLTGEMLCAELERTGANSVATVSLAAPLTTFEYGDQRTEDSTDLANSEIEPSDPLPDTCLIAVSSANDITVKLKESAARFGAKGDDLPAEFGNMTVPGRSPWQRVVESAERLIADRSAVAWHDPLALDHMMYWQTMDLPKHPSNPMKLNGKLSDVFVLRSGKSGKGMRVLSMRAVNLVCASMDEAPSEDMEECGVLAHYLKKHTEDLQAIKDSETTDSIEAKIARSSEFSKILSDHWPVLAAVELSGEVSHSEGR